MFPLPTLFLLLFLLAGVVPPAAAQKTLSLQPSGMLTMMEHAVPTGVYFDSPDDGLDGALDVAASGDLLFVTGFDDNALSVWRVNAEVGTLRQTMFYRNNTGEIDGLGGAAGVAVSDDGELLFVTGSLDDALSVWRVNYAAGTLSQTAVYQDSGLKETDTRYIAEVDGRVDGLSGARDVALSGDGELLFVTGSLDDELSVWRVNAEAGTLRRTAIYQDDLREIDGLDGATSVVVSGELLFVTGFEDNALSVWRVNAEAGTLSQTALYEDGIRGIDGLEGAAGVAVSDDGNLLFVTGFRDNSLSVWQVNAEAGTLTQMVRYRDRILRNQLGPGGGIPVDGLSDPRGVAVSGDLLFVTGRASDALSVWRVNAETGTLRQKALYQDPAVQDGFAIAEVDGQVDGLNGAWNIAVSGDLLFVAGFDADALSVWHINNAEVPLEVQTLIRVQTDRPVSREVMVTVTAQSGARRTREATVTLSPGILSEDAIFPPGALSPGGRWIFTARTDSPDVLDTITARTAVQVLPPLLSLKPQQELFAVGNTVTLTVRAIAGVPADTTYRITFLNRASPQTISSITVMHPAGSTEVTVLIPGQSLSTGQWEFSIQLPNNSPFQVGGGSTATAGIVIPVLQLVPLQDQYALGGKVTLSVQANVGVPTDTFSEVIAVDIASRRILYAIAVDLPANTTAQEVSFPARLFSSSRQWEFIILLPFDSPFRADRRLVISILAPALSLQPSGMLTMMEHAVPTGVYFDSPDDGLDGALDVAASGELLFVTGNLDNALSVWRVNAEAGTLSQTARYEDGIRGINGLAGASGVAVSDDGELLFVTGSLDDALSVWRVNYAAGTLSQTAVYQDSGLKETDTYYIAEVDGRVDGLSGARDVALSGDGELLFVTGSLDDELSVWRVNAEAGTLRRTAIYRDDLREIDGLDGATSVVVSGELLFVTGFEDNALSVWRVNAEVGTLSQTALYEDGIRGIDGLEGAAGVAVSGDGNLLFVTGFRDNSLSVWQVNAEAGTLTQMVRYRDRILRNQLEPGGGIPVDGLSDPRGVAVSGDLLFVTGRVSDALSVWQVNAETGTLRQKALYQDPAVQDGFAIAEVDGQVDGLNGAWNIAVSGDLLFVAGFDADALSVWHINNAEVPLEVQTLIRVQTDRPVPREVMVTVTAQSGARRTREATVTLSPGILSEDAIFPPGALSPGGRWIFTARTDSPDVLDTITARTVVQVLPPLLSLKPQQELFALGNTVTLTVRAIAGVPADTTYRITFLNRASPQTISSIIVMHPAGSTEVTVLIPGQSLSTGQWEFSIQLPDNSPFQVGGGSTATAGIVIPVLQLVPLQDQYAVGGKVTLSVQANVGVPTDTFSEVIAVDIASRRILYAIAVDIPANTTAHEVSFPARLFSSPRQWEFIILLPHDTPFYSPLADRSLVIPIIAPALSLQPSGVLTMMEHAVPTEVYRDSLATDGLSNAVDTAVSGDLLFVTAFRDDALSVWRVNAEAGTLTQTAVYQDLIQRSPIADVDGLFGGLSGAWDVAVSGNLLFVTARIDASLSVWRINEMAGTLTQTARYQSNVNGIAGLDRASGVAVSGDGKLLFVTGELSDAISVWRVNAEVGTLSQTVVYRDNSTGNDGLDGAWDVAVSDNLLFVTGAGDDALSVWRVNAEEGTLARTALYRNGDQNGENRIDGLDEPRAVTVSDDLLFVTGFGDAALSVWRVNAEAGTLSQTAVYRDRDPGIGGLEGAERVAVSDDGELLFVTASRRSGAVSIWRVNAEAGTLSQTAVYRNNRARGVTVSGDLLFVASSFGSALSVWHINNAEVPFGLPVEIRVQSDIPVSREVKVTVTAQSGTRMEAAAVTLSPDRLSADAMFSVGRLSPGRWIFTAQAEPPALLNIPTGAARIAMQVVLAPVELTLDVPGSVTVGNTFTVTVGVPAETPLQEGVSVTATLSFSAGDGEEIEGVVLTSARSSAQATFTAPGIAGRYTVAVRGADGASLLLVVVTTAQVTVQPVLALDVPSAPIYRGVMFPVRVRLLGGLLEDNGSVGVTVYLRDAVTDAVVLTRTATLSTAASSMVLTFEAPPGEAAVTPYGLTTEDIDQTGLALMTSLSLQSAPPATVFVTRINADLSGNGVFDPNDVILIARGFLTENHTARIAGGFSQLGPDTFQVRLEELADFGDISGNGVLDIIDLIFLTRNTDATVSDLRARVLAGDNPFAYLCGSTAGNTCEDIDSPHQNITEGIRYEAIVEVLDDLRRVPQPPMLPSPNNP